MIRNKKHGTYPMIVHAPGTILNNPLWNEVLSVTKYAPMFTRLSQDITIFTYNNGSAIGHNLKPMGLFERILDSHKIKYVVLGSDTNKWSNRYKIRLLRDALSNVITPYILSCDSSDVFLVNNIDRMSEKFESMCCEALFNAEKMSWPNNVPEQILEFDKSLNSDYHLNSGVWMAKTGFAKELYEFIIGLDLGSEGSEQLCHRYAYPVFFPRMKVDYESKMFQVINRCGLEELELIKLF